MCMHSIHSGYVEISKIQSTVSHNITPLNIIILSVTVYTTGWVKKVTPPKTFAHILTCGSSSADENLSSYLPFTSSSTLSQKRHWYNTIQYSFINRLDITQANNNEKTWVYLELISVLVQQAYQNVSGNKAQQKPTSVWRTCAFHRPRWASHVCVRFIWNSIFCWLFNSSVNASSPCISPDCRAKNTANPHAKSLT